MRAKFAGWTLVVSAAWCGSAWAQGSEDLARHFGFDPPRTIVVDRGPGPFLVADMNGDGLRDVVVVNNRKSRIELHLQRAQPLSVEEAATTSPARPNELPKSRYYDMREVSVSHRVTGLRAHDADGDGRLDLIYAGQPPEVVVLRQTEGAGFETLSKRRVTGLAAGRDGIAVADLVDGPEPEVAVIAGGRLQLFPLRASGSLGEPRMLGAAAAGNQQQVVAFFVEDYDGNGMQDVLAAIPDDAAPLRLWLQKPAAGGGSGKRGVMGPEVRFEMPPLREAEPVRFPGRAAASIAVIERTTRRLVTYDLTTTPVAPAGSLGSEREVQADVYAFAEADAKDRAVVVADIDGDGLLDLLATDPRGNSLALHRQKPGVGLSASERFSAFKAPKALAAGQWDGSGPLEVFVLSEEERAVGVASYDPASERLSFPQPIPVATAGALPVAMGFVELGDGPALAVVAQNKREHTLEVHRPGRPAADAMRVALEGVNRAPRSMLAADVDHDGFIDLLLFTPGEPMVMVRGLDDPAGPKALIDKTMPQFGLVQAAGPDNTGLLDVDGDGRDELLIADKNFVRAAAFSPESGWRVVEQVTETDPGTNFAGLAVLRDESGAPTIVAADKAGKRLVMMTRAVEGTGAKGWLISDRLRLTGFDPTALHAGSFTGQGSMDVLAIGADGFGVVRLTGDRASLEEVAAWRSSDEKRLEHEAAAGDLNSDGFVDLAVLDAGEQRCTILTFTASRRLLEATEFQVFQSRLFQGGETREFEPSMALIDDVTGDGAADLILLVHDRVMIYPQMTATSAASAQGD